MIKITHFCDHCGKEIKQDEHGQYEGLVDVKFDFPSTNFDATLCDDCYNELLTLIDEFLRGEKVNYGAEISLLEELSADENIDEPTKIAIEDGIKIIREQHEQIEKLTYAYTAECSLNNAKKEISDAIERVSKQNEAQIKKNAINGFVRELKECAKYQHDSRDLHGNLYVTVGEIEFIAEKLIGGD